MNISLLYLKMQTTTLLEVSKEGIHSKFKNLYKNTSLEAKGALAHRLQLRTAAKSKMAARGPQNDRWGLERCLPLDFWEF